MTIINQDITTFVKKVSNGDYTNEKAKMVLSKLCNFYNIGLEEKLKLEETINTYTKKF